MTQEIAEKGAGVPADTGYAAPTWAFDGEVTRVFDDMLARSIPGYLAMRRLVTEVGNRYVQRKTTVVDLGCSRGEALAPFVERHGAQCRFIGVEVSEPMLAAARERFQGYINCGIVDIRKMDLRREYPLSQASLTLSVLTLMFVPIEHRQRIARQAYENTAPGGALVLVEKILGCTAEMDALLVERYYAHKAERGYSQDDIERKRLSLEGVLVPVTARWNEELLRDAGFAQVECFWRHLNFAAWVAVRGG
jgi:tRNA (cmo5U34)-methyltransferase